jgi:hypothetical protein
MLQVFYLDVAYICNCFSSVFHVEGPKMTTRGEGEWEPQISFEIFGRYPNVTTKRNQVLETQIPKLTGDESTLNDSLER